MAYSEMIPYWQYNEGATTTIGAYVIDSGSGELRFDESEEEDTQSRKYFPDKPKLKYLL
jgi:hypothetical protein